MRERLERDREKEMDKETMMPTCRGERGRGQDTTFHYTRRAREREYERNRERQR